jgi:hypothetical protein
LSSWGAAGWWTEGGEVSTALQRCSRVMLGAEKLAISLDLMFLWKALWAERALGFRRLGQLPWKARLDSGPVVAGARFSIFFFFLYSVSSLSLPSLSQREGASEGGETRARARTRGLNVTRDGAGNISRQAALPRRPVPSGDGAWPSRLSVVVVVVVVVETSSRRRGRGFFRGGRGVAWV